MAKTAGKFHIGRDGVPTVCKAMSGKCPFTAGGHFDTFAQAAEVSEERFLKEYGIWEEKKIEPSKTREIKIDVTFRQATYIDENGNAPHHFNKILKGLSNESNSRRGLAHEAYGAYSYAEENNLDSAVIYNNSGKETVLTDNNELTQGDVDKVYIDTQSKILKELKKTNTLVVEKDKLIKGIYFSKDSDVRVAQMGGSGVLDIAVIKGDKVEFIEYKKGFGTGAQLPSVALSVDKTGRPIITDKSLDPTVAKEVSRVGFKNTFKTNPSINITERESLNYLVSSYKAKGASKLDIMDKNGNTVEFDLSGSNESIVETLKDKGVSASVKLRSNMVFNNPTDEDKERWSTKRHSYFKSNKFPEDSFTLKDLKVKPSEFGLCGGKVAVGELVLPYSRRELDKLPPDTKIKVSSLKVRGLTLIGSLKMN